MGTMTHEKRTQNTPSTSKRKAWLVTKGFIAGSVMSIAPVPYGWDTTDGLTTLPENAKNVTAPPPNDSVKAAAVTGLRKHLVDMIIGYQQRDRDTLLTEVAASYDPERVKQLEFVREWRNDETGFHATMLVDKTNGETSLVFSGMDFGCNQNFFADMDDAVMLSTGNVISQTQDAIDCARQAQILSQKRFGHPIVNVVAHSLGAANAQTPIGMGILPDAKCYLYDGPGTKNINVRVCAKLSGKSEEEVSRILKENVVEFRYWKNLLNTMGNPSGLGLEAYPNGDESQSIGDKFCARFFPSKHVFNDEFISDLKALKDTDFHYRGPSDDNSNAPQDVITLCLMLAFVAPEVLERLWNNRKSAADQRWESRYPSGQRQGASSATR